MIVDSHCHLNHQQLRDDVTGAVERAAAASVEKMVVVGYDLPSSEEAVRLTTDHPAVFAAVAIHPHDAKDYDSSSEARLIELAADPKVVAIGEIGLDYHYDLSPREEQFHAFRAQLALAKEMGLPVIIHCREAYTDVLDVLEREGGAEIGGVMHCWAGTTEEANRTLALGFYLGFGGVITFKNAEEIRQIATASPLDSILLETDAPYLAPMPYRGKRNEPAYTRLVAEKLAEIRGISVGEVERVTTDNCRTLFHRL